MNLNVKEKIENSHLVSYLMNLTTLSPVFIGGGNEADLNRSNYIIQNDIVYVLDDKKWQDYIFENNLFNSFHDFMKQSGEQLAPNKPRAKPKTNTPSLSDFINKLSKKPELESISKYHVRAAIDRPNKLTTFIKNTKGNPYFPGSSIKGAIRTAIIAEILSRQTINKKEQLVEEIKSCQNKKQLEKYNADFINEILSKIQIDTDNRMLKSIMRCLNVSDSLNDISIKDLTIYKKQDLLISKKIPPKTEIPLYREYFISKEPIKILITFDKKLIKSVDTSYRYLFEETSEYIDSLLWFIEKYYKSLLEDTRRELFDDNKNKSEIDTFETEEDRKKAKTDYVWNQMKLKKVPSGLQSQKIKEFEEEFDKKHPLSNRSNALKLYDNSQSLVPNINIGGASGFNTKIILKALAKNDQEYLELKKYILNLRYDKHHHGETNNVHSPLYLKLANNFTIGWCNIQEVQQIC